MTWWRFLSRFMLAVPLLLGLSEITATLILKYVVPFETFKRYATVAQYEARAGHNYPFSYQSGFGIYPNPGYIGGLNRHNALGFRGGAIPVPKASHTFRIVCLGGSTTYDVAVEDWHNAYPAQLEKVLREKGYDVEVVNAGGPSWTSREQLLNYTTRVSWIEPDLIVLYEGINDLVFRSVWPPQKLRTDYTDADRFVPEFAKMPWYWNLTLVRAAMIFSGRAYPAAAIDPWWGDTIKSEGIRNLLSAAPALMKAYRATSTLPPGVSTSQLFEASTPMVYRKNLSTLVNCAKADGVDVLITSFAADWPEIRATFVDHGEGFALGVQQMNDTNRSVADERKVRFFDLAAAMPEERGYWADIVHNNDVGAAAKAALIGDYLDRNGVIPSRYLNPSHSTN